MKNDEFRDLLILSFATGVLVGVAAIMLILVLVRNITEAQAAEIEVTPEYIEITEGPESAVYVADTDDCPYNSAVPMSEELQGFLWERCKDVTDDYKTLYTFMLGLIDQESEFTPTARSSTGDYGLCQTNKKWVYPDVKKAFGLSDITDCYDPYISINCCLWELQHKLNSYGISERLYYYYNTGNTSGSSNRNSRSMVQKWKKWEAIIWDSSLI